MFGAQRPPPLSFTLPIFFCAIIFLLYQHSSIILSLPSPSVFPTSFPGRQFLNPQQPSLSPSPKNHTLNSWITHLRSLSPDHKIRTNRTACREHFSGGQSCIFEGLTCIDTRPWSQRNLKPGGRIPIILIKEDETDKRIVPHDRWCSLKHLTADPRNGGPRLWNVEKGTVAPGWSCLDAEYRNWTSLLQENVRDVKFVDEPLWIVDLDYIGGTHNNHFLKDVVWILDLVLWQKSLELGEGKEKLFPERARHVVFPGGVGDFRKSMGKDINRLVWALQLQLDLGKLYGQGVTKMPPSSESDWYSERITLPFTEAYPEILDEQRMLFHKDLVTAANDTQTWTEMMSNSDKVVEKTPLRKGTENEKKYDLICSPGLLAGAKLPGYGHERVCHEMRKKSWELFGIKEAPVSTIGVYNRAPPPKRILIVNRHVTRRIINAHNLADDLRGAFEPYGVEVELTSTKMLKTGEANVRAYARAGVLISPHGSQSMSLMFMPRWSAVVEVFPRFYRHYAYRFACESCNIFHFEVYGQTHPRTTQEEYNYCLKTAGPLEMSSCARGGIKSVDIPVRSEDVIEKVFLAFAKIGYDLKKVELNQN